MWPNPQENTDLVTFTEGIFNGKLHYLCSDNFSQRNLNSRSLNTETFLEVDRQFEMARTSVNDVNSFMTKIPII